MTRNCIRRAWPLGLAAAALVALAAIAPSARAADPTPELVFQYPPDGITVNQPIFGIQLCFADKINIRDLPAGGDFAFTITTPSGEGLGNRDVFQPDAYGITVYPGKATGNTIGEWVFTYRVTSPDGESPLEGEIRYTVDPDGEPNPQATPPPCIGEGGTATVTPTPEATAAPVSSSGNSTAASASGTVRPGSQTPSPSPVIESDDDPDIDKYAFLTIGAAGIVAIIASIGYVVRKRVGYDPHAPTGHDDDSHH